MLNNVIHPDMSPLKSYHRRTAMMDGNGSYLKSVKKAGASHRRR